MPKISVVIITYNRARLLPEAIESVLSQSFKDWELLIVDDASTDGTESVVKKYIDKDERIGYYKNESNIKISRSRNRGLELARGKYIAVLDSDDSWCDVEKLQKQYDFLEQNADFVLSAGGVIVIGDNSQEIKRYLKTSTDEDIRSGILAQNPIVHSAVMYRREIALSSGGYDVALNTAEDYDLWLRIGRKGKMYNFSEYFVRYRIHGNNISIIDRRESMKCNLELVRKYRYDYPNFWRAWLRRKIRLWGYFILKGELK